MSQFFDKMNQFKNTIKLTWIVPIPKFMWNIMLYGFEIMNFYEIDIDIICASC